MIKIHGMTFSKNQLKHGKNDLSNCKNKDGERQQRHSEMPGHVRGLCWSLGHRCDRKPLQNAEEPYNLVLER